MAVMLSTHNGVPIAIELPARVTLEITETERRKLGRLLADRTRHLLLMTATPNNGKTEDFQLFLGLLDNDRFGIRMAEGSLNAALNEQTVIAKLAQLGSAPMIMSPAAFGALLTAETDKWAKVIRAAGIKPE